MSDSLSIAAVLLAIEAGVLLSAEHRLLRRIFNFLPTVFWIYFLPGVVVAAGAIRPGAGLKTLFSFSLDHLLPAALVLLLLSVDLPAILRLGWRALFMMLAGSGGILIGGPLVILLLGRWLPEKIWMGFGALSGSWIGGSANMVAVKEAIGTPESMYSLMVVVDTIVAYSWMGLVIALATVKRRYDRWTLCHPRLMDDLGRRTRDVSAGAALPLSLPGLAAVFAVAFIGSAVAWHVGCALPKIPNIANESTWRIIVASTLGIVLSFTPLRRLERFGATKAGYAMLFFVLACIGARADFSRFAEVPILLLAGAVWVLIHAGVLVAASRLVRAPMFLTATASQANIGGPASAPIVAEAYQPGLANVGLLMAILGNIIGTYLGLVCSRLCYWAAFVVGKA